MFQVLPGSKAKPKEPVIVPTPTEGSAEVNDQNEIVENEKNNDDKEQIETPSNETTVEKEESRKPAQEKTIAQIDAVEKQIGCLREAQAVGIASGASANI